MQNDAKIHKIIELIEIEVVMGFDIDKEKYAELIKDAVNNPETEFSIPEAPEKCLMCGQAIKRHD